MKYIIYTWLGCGYELIPNHIDASNEEEAMEVLCASENANRIFIPIDELDDKDISEYEKDDRYTYIDSTMVGGKCGYLLIENMIIKTM